MWMSKVKTTAALLALLGVLGVGAGYAVKAAAGGAAPEASPTEQPRPQEPPVKVEPAAAPEPKEEPLNLKLGSAAQAVAFSPDGRWVVAGGKDGTVRQWDSGGKEARSMKAGREAVRALAFAPDGKTLATGDASGRVLVWDDRPNPNDPRVVETGVTDVHGLAFSPDGKFLAVSGNGNAVRVFDASSRKVVREMRATDLKEALGPLLFSPDGTRLLATGQVALNEGANWTAFTMFDLESGKILFTVEGPKQDRQRLPELAGYRAPAAFSPDGNLLAGARRRGNWPATAAS